MSVASTPKSDRDRLLEKIQKCMRLSKSSEPHEAAAAMRQAQKLMEHHQVSDSELLGMEVKSVHICTPSPYKRKTPLHYTYLIAIVRKAFGVEAVMEASQYYNKKGYARMHLGVRYFGIGGRADMAAYAHEVIFRQLMTGWAQYKKAHPEAVGERGGRMGWMVGWLQAVRSTVMEFAGEDDEGLVRKAIESKYPTLGKGKTNNMALSGRTQVAGREAAAGFSIHRPMTGQAQKRLS